LLSLLWISQLGLYRLVFFFEFCEYFYLISKSIISIVVKSEWWKIVSISTFGFHFTHKKKTWKTCQTWYHMFNSKVFHKKGINKYFCLKLKEQNITLQTIRQTHSSINVKMHINTTWCNLHGWANISTSHYFRTFYWRESLTTI